MSVLIRFGRLAFATAGFVAAVAASASASDVGAAKAEGQLELAAARPEGSGLSQGSGIAVGKRLGPRHARGIYRRPCCVTYARQPAGPALILGVRF